MSSLHVVGSTHGVTLVFPSLEDLDRVAQQLSGMAEWIHSEDMKPPYVYHTADDRFSNDELDQYTDWIKYIFGQSDK